jgi:hypothetical protein
MKKIITVVLLTLALNTKAQDIVPITYGPFISMTSTTLVSDPEFIDQIPGAGYNIGGFVRLKLLFLYGQGEVSFGNKSASVTVQDTGSNSALTFKLKGMDVSLLLGLKLIGLGDMGNLRVFGGYNWNNYSDISYSIDGNKFEANNVNSNNHSLVGGVGVDLAGFTFDIRYLSGFIDLTESGSTDVESRILNISLGYKFR